MGKGLRPVIIVTCAAVVFMAGTALGVLISSGGGGPSSPSESKQRGTVAPSRPASTRAETRGLDSTPLEIEGTRQMEGTRGERGK